MVRSQLHICFESELVMMDQHTLIKRKLEIPEKLANFQTNRLCDEIVHQIDERNDLQS
jgi:hypothetical protein